MNALFVFDPCFGPWIGYPLVALAALALLGDALLHNPPPVLWRRGVRTGLRLLLLLPLAVLLLRPTQINAEALQTQPTLAVVFDSSKSLDLPRPGSNPASPRREPAALLHARQMIPLLQTLPGRHEAWALNDSLNLLPAAPEKITVWPACGGGSALGDGLADLINAATPARPGSRCDAVILYTDGAITRGRGWAETLAQLQTANAPVFVFAVGDPGETGPPAFLLDRLDGPDRLHAGESARYTAVVQAPGKWTGTATLRLRWKVDGVECGVHERPAPQNGALCLDEITLPFPAPGLARLSLELETPNGAPPAMPPQVSKLIAVEPQKVRLLFWSMKLTRHTRALEEQLARDSVLSVNVAGDFFRARAVNVDNALRSADVLLWEDPDLARLPASTLALVESRLKEGMGLIVLASPRLELSKSAVLLGSLPAQAGAPWQQIAAKPVIPAELRNGHFWNGAPPPLPEFSGRLQQFETARDLAGFAAVITTTEGRPILLAGHPAPNRATAVLLTPDWPADDEATVASSTTAGSPAPALGLGALIRHTAHWAVGADLKPGQPAIFLRLSDDRPLPDQPVYGSLETANLDAGRLTEKTFTLTCAEVRTEANPGSGPGTSTGTGTVPATPIEWHRVNGQIRFRWQAPRPGLYQMLARFEAAPLTLKDAVFLCIPGEELEAAAPPDHAHLQQVAATTGGRFFLAAQTQPADVAALQSALQARLTPQPATQVGRRPLGGGGFTAAWMIGILLVELILRARRWW